MTAPELPLLNANSEGENWYYPGASSRPLNIAQLAYQDAVEYYRKELTNDQFKQIAILQHNSISDVQQVLVNAQKLYEGRHKGQKRAKKWLQRFSSQVLYYGKVLDVLVQQYPEYVSLAWGAMKFVFIGVTNHEELLVQYTKVLTEIGQLLPRADLHASLYPTDRVKEALSLLYAHIIKFLQDAVKWYRKNSASRALKSIYNPFDLQVKETVESISECSRHVDQIASAAARAELRDVHLKVDQLTKATTRIETTVSKTLPDPDRIKDELWKLQLGKLLKSLAVGPEPADGLQIVLAAARQHHHLQVEDRLLRQLCQALSLWASSPNSVLFVLKAGPQAKSTTTTLAAKIIGLVQSSNYHSAWYFSSSSLSRDKAPTTTDILKAIIMQVLNCGGGSPTLGRSNLSTCNPESEHSEDEWFSLLQLIVRQIPKLFLIIEAGPQLRPSHKEGQESRRFEDLLLRLVDSANSCDQQLKVLFVSHRASNDWRPSLKESRGLIAVTVRQSALLPAGRRHVATQRSRELPVRLSKAFDGRTKGRNGV